MHFNKNLPYFVAALLIGLFSSFAAQAAAPDPIRFSGAISIARMIKAEQPDIESRAGEPLALIANGSGHGIEDLAAGRSDVAMIAGPMKFLVDVVNAKTPGTVNITDLKKYGVGSIPLYFVVNTSNNIDSLNVDQIRDILAGRIQNWKDVGGADLPIIVVVPPLFDGGRATIATELMINDQITQQARTVNLGPDVNAVVAQEPGAISFIPSEIKADTVKSLKTNINFREKLALATKGNVSDPVKNAVIAVQDALIPH